MKIFKIIGKGNQFHWVNLEIVMFVEFDDEVKEIVFDGIMRIKVEEREYDRVRKDIWGKMFDLP